MNRLVILAGGKSTRMGTDKMFLKTEGKTFIERIYCNASYCFDEIFISTDSEVHADKIRTLIPEAKIVIDSYKEIGPVGGLLSVYEKTGADGFAVTAVDTPFMLPELLLHLKEECKGAALMLKIADKLEPLTAYYSEEALKLFARAVADGHYSIISALYDKYDTITIEKIIENHNDLSKQEIEKAVMNINTKKEYEALHETSSNTSGA